MTVEENVSLPNHTIYSPADLNRFGGDNRLPVVVFAGPGCDFSGTAFRPFFTELASHGFLLLVSGPPEPKGGSGPAFPKTKASDLIDSIEWACHLDSIGGKFRGKADGSKIALMGQSCGGLEALSLAADARVKTVVLCGTAAY